MTHYSDNPGSVRVIRFKPGGKWYDEFVIDMAPFYGEPLLDDAIIKAWNAAHGDWQGWDKIRENWTIVVLEPYHEHGHPRMFVARCMEDIRGKGPGGRTPSHAIRTT